MSPPREAAVQMALPLRGPCDGGYPARVALAPRRIVNGAEEGSSGGKRQDSAVKSFSHQAALQARVPLKTLWRTHG